MLNSLIVVIVALGILVAVAKFLPNSIVGRLVSSVLRFLSRLTGILERKTLPEKLKDEVQATRAELGRQEDAVGDLAGQIRTTTADLEELKRELKTRNNRCDRALEEGRDADAQIEQTRILSLEKRIESTQTTLNTLQESLATAETAVTGAHAEVAQEEVRGDLMSQEMQAAQTQEGALDTARKVTEIAGGVSTGGIGQTVREMQRERDRALGHVEVHQRVNKAVPKADDWRKDAAKEEVADALAERKARLQKKSSDAAPANPATPNG